MGNMMKSHMPRPLCLIENLTDGFKVNEETVTVISKITSPITVVAITGPYSTGKSYLLNRLMGRNDGFPLGSTIHAKTKGIWIWYCDHPEREDEVLVLLDTEGLGDFENASATNDNHIFLLATLLSSTLVYNTSGAIQNDAIEKLRFVSEITELIKVRSSTVAGEDDGKELYQFFPDFIWTVRDFTLQLELDGKPITADEILNQAVALKHGSGVNAMFHNLPRENLRKFFRSLKCFVFDRPVNDTEKLKRMETLEDEELEPKFIEMAQSFCDHVFSNTMLKTHKGKALNGRSFCELSKIYVETLNSGEFPCLENVFNTLIDRENTKAVENALKDYDQMRLFLDLPRPKENLNQLSQLHQMFVKNAVEVFSKMLFKDKDMKYQIELQTQLEYRYTRILDEDAKASENVCWELLGTLSEEMDQKVANSAYTTPGGFDQYSTDKATVLQEYAKETGKGVKADGILQLYLEKEEAVGQNVLAADTQMSDMTKEAEAGKQKSELAEQRELAAREEVEKQKMHTIDMEFMHEKIVDQMKHKFDKESKQRTDALNKVLEMRVEEKARLLTNGFEEKAEKMQETIDSLKSHIQNSNRLDRVELLKCLMDRLALF